MRKPSLVLALLCACSVSDEPVVDQSCDDAAYDNGVCDPTLSCAVPDIDCFATFGDDAAATSWYAGFETRLAQEQRRPPRTLLPQSDSRYASTRALLDEGWAAFRKARPVGKLGDERPGLVLVDDQNPNAFVVPDLDLKRAGFSVQVQTGLLAVTASEDAKLALIMHELQHAVGLHVIPGAKDRVRTHYVAPEGIEPIGREQVDDPTARAAIDGWRKLAEQLGPYSAMELGGFPITGQLWDVISVVLNYGLMRNPTGCARARTLITSFRSDVLTSVDKLGGALRIELAPLATRWSAALGALHDECVPNLTDSFVQVVAVITNQTPQQVTAGMSASDLQIVTGRHVVVATAALTVDRRKRMRAFETMLPQGRPWSAARYFSTEEDADDVSMMVMRAADREPTAMAEMLTNLLVTIDADAGARCKTLLASSGTPAYGVDLTDEHHDTCWRAYHVTQLATDPSTPRLVPSDAPPIALEVPTLPFPDKPQLVFD